MAKFMFLLYEDETPYIDGGDDYNNQMGKLHGEFVAANQPAVIDGHGLQLTSSACSVREGVVHNTPFAESPHPLGGYYLVEAPDMAAAVELAKRVPVVNGGVEVRPIETFEGGR
ncbi:YciI family protein [Streptomyces filamentosus]|uniref:YciI family protein n=1 Tax=Streptomyces filamentosus TaxID=67294 RepID=UPI0037CEFEDA